MEHSERREAVERLYDLLGRLAEATGGPRPLGLATGRDGWPAHGVYFFLEPGEFREDGTSPRVVRIGTHALTVSSRTRLWTRLRTHRGRIGGTNPGSGNHRASIFRSHVGLALIARHGYGEAASTWSEGSNARREIRERELLLERRVTQHIGSMHVFVLPVSEREHRSAIERGCIALLSNYDREPIDAASDHWLGRLAKHQAIARSGLWNVNHVAEQTGLATLDLVESYRP